MGKEAVGAGRRVADRLTEAAARIDAAYAAYAAKEGLTFNGLMLMCILAQGGYVTQRDICEQLMLSKSTVRSMLLPFMRSGEVELLPGANRKEKAVALTDAGRSRYLPMVKALAAVEDDAVREFGSKRAEALADAYEELAGIASSRAAALALGADVARVTRRGDDDA